MRTQETHTFKITAAGQTIEIPLKLEKYNGENYFIRTSQVAKVVKGIAKAAGFKVLGYRSEVYTGWNSIAMYLETNLTQEEIDFNHSLDYMERHRRVSEPKLDIARNIENAFQAGRFNSSEDIYEYDENRLRVKAPNGKMLDLTVKYISIYFTTKEAYKTI